MNAQDKRVLAALVGYGAIDPLQWADNKNGFDGTWDYFFRVSRLPRDLDKVYAALDRLRGAGWLADYEDDDVRLSAWTWASLVHDMNVPDATTVLAGNLSEARVKELVTALVAQRKRVVQ